MTYLASTQIHTALPTLLLPRLLFYQLCYTTTLLCYYTRTIHHPPCRETSRKGTPHWICPQTSQRPIQRPPSAALRSSHVES